MNNWAKQYFNNNKKQQKLQSASDESTTESITRDSYDQAGLLTGKQLFLLFNKQEKLRNNQVRHEQIGKNPWWGSCLEHFSSNFVDGQHIIDLRHTPDGESSAEISPEPSVDC